MHAILLAVAFLFAQPQTAQVPPKTVVSSVDTNPLRSAVRIRTYASFDGRGWQTYGGSGTVIHSTPEESIILTCQHIFAKRNKDMQIDVDLFDGVAHGPAEQAAKMSTARVENLIEDIPNDLAVLWIKPGKLLPVNRLCPVSYQPQHMEEMTVIGCRHLADPNAFKCTVEFPEWPIAVSPPLGPDFVSVKCTAAASPGRSGGGLFNRAGQLCGVLSRCSGFNDGYQGCSWYVHPKIIRKFLDKHKLSYLYESKP